jgi:putative oxidoreductase
MIKKLFETSEDITPFVLRVFVGFLMLMHGMQKLFGWFGGEGMSGTMTHLMGMGMPAYLATLYMMCDPLVCLGLVPGFMTRIAALLLTIEMTVAIFMIQLPYGLFMNWSGRQSGEGMEYNLLVIVVAIALMIRGGGKWSIDRLISRMIELLMNIVQSSGAAGRMVHK